MIYFDFFECFDRTFFFFFEEVLFLNFVLSAGIVFLVSECFRV